MSGRLSKGKRLMVGISPALLAGSLLLAPGLTSHAAAEPSRGTHVAVVSHTSTAPKVSGSYVQGYQLGLADSTDCRANGRGGYGPAQQSAAFVRGYLAGFAVGKVLNNCP